MGKSATVISMASFSAAASDILLVLRLILVAAKW